MSLIPLGFLASLAAGLATGLGAIPVLFIKRAPERLLDAMLGFAAGVMLAATVTSTVLATSISVSIKMKAFTAIVISSLPFV